MSRRARADTQVRGREDLKRREQERVRDNS